MQRWMLWTTGTLSSWWWNRGAQHPGDSLPTNCLSMGADPDPDPNPTNLDNAFAFSDVWWLIHYSEKREEMRWPLWDRIVVFTPCLHSSRNVFLRSFHTLLIKYVINGQWSLWLQSALILWLQILLREGREDGTGEEAGQQGSCSGLLGINSPYY